MYINEEKSFHYKKQINGINGMKVEEIMHNCDMRKKILNPFVHRLPQNTTYDYFKIAFTSLILLPLRIFVIILLLLIGYVIAQIGLFGLSKEDLSLKPHRGWRRGIRWCLGFLGRMMMRCYAFHWVKIKGKLASRSEAPIIVVGPHTSFMDAIAVFWSNVPGLVNRVEDLQLPFFGKYITFTQPVSIKREDAKSRQTSIMEIQKRATSKDDWSPLIIFPEGTCTNRSCLITFKPGAFYPGVPVQPLIIRFPNKIDCITWTWDGPGAVKTILTTLCQFHNYCELEYLPVYYPNQEEIANPFLYAANVRQVMADALGVPVVDYTYDDCRLMHKARQCNLPSEVGLIEVQKLRKKLGKITVRNVQEVLKHYSEISRTKGKISLIDFSVFLRLSHLDPFVVDLFNMFDKEGYGIINFRDYLITWHHIQKEVTSDEAINYIFKMVDKYNEGKVFLRSFVKFFGSPVGMAESDSTELFRAIDANSKGFITSEDFRSYSSLAPEYAKIFLLYHNFSKNGILLPTTNCNGLI